jgi:hypothetical protein
LATSQNVSGVRYNKGYVNGLPLGVTVLSPDTYLVLVPDAAPPYDCDIHGMTCQSPGSPAARFPVPLPASPSPLAPCAGGAWPRQFAQAIVETLAGTRPVRQLLRWTTERTQAHIQTLCSSFRTDASPKIQRVLSSSPSAGVVEVTVIAGFGARTRALAMRFEYIAARQPAPGLSGRPARWLCTDLETA